MKENLEEGQLLRELLPKKKQAFWRVVWINEHDNEIYLFPVSEVTPTGTKLPKRRPYNIVQAQLADRFEQVEDHIVLPDMILPEAEIPENIKKVRDDRYALIASLVTESAPELYSKSTRGHLLRQHSEKVGKPESTIRRLLVAYWNFGCNSNAMLELRARFGGAGKSREAGHAPRGRPNASIVLHGEEKGAPNRNLSEFDKETIRQALMTHFIDADKNYSATREEMLIESYPNGNGPKYTTFYSYAKKVTSTPEWLEAKAGAKEMRERHANARGHARDIASGAGDITDVDGTPFPQELIASWAPARAIRKPTLIVAIDRYSYYITGFYDSMVPENWDGVRMCLFSTLTSKDELLAEYGLEPHHWRTGAHPAGIFFDRGVSKTATAKAALCDELKMEIIWAPPGHPEGKPTAEGMLGKIQNRMMYGPGSTKGSGRIKDVQRVKKAIDLAEWTPWRFRKELVDEIILHNKFTDVSHLLTREMMDSERPPAPTPEGIYFWNQQQLRGGRAKRLSDEELYFGLLRRVHVAIYPSGVRFKKHAFSSPGLMAYRLSKISALGNKRNCWTNVYWDPLTPSRLYWRNPEGRLEILLPDNYSADLLRQKTWADIAVDRMRMLVTLEEVDARKQEFQVARSKAVITRKQEKNIEPTLALAAPIKKTRINKKSTAVARDIEYHLQQQDLLDKVTPTIEKVVGKASLMPSPAVRALPNLSDEEAEDFMRRMMEN
ncbi:hypothetical protein [Paraburkholderia sp. GAS334]|uniref:hypothetical protein n=1 Tax=Paraburkholderia sp. GAS334 TaxID=3035131 RepID=UPI003D2033BA